jgi:iron complex transport system ATP-binding protein
VDRAVRLLDVARWTVRRGEHWVVMGPNGGGKTTLLACLAGYAVPSRGTMTVLGRTYGRADWRDLRRDVGLVSPALEQRVEPDETALETVASGAKDWINYWGPIPAADRVRARRLLRDTGLAALADRPWGQLSLGERRRVFIARALMVPRRLLLLDEPCAGLDPLARSRFLAFLRKHLLTRRSPVAVVMATHHAEDVVPGFTHALLLRGGRTVAAGPLRDTLTAASLSRAFGAPVSLALRGGRYELTMPPRRAR